MKLKKPFFSRELIGNNLRRFWWIAVLYTLALFLVSPLITLTNETDVIPKSGYNISFHDIYDGTIIFLLTIPVFIGVMVFRYMQNSKSMVLLHSMPYTRLRLYVNNVISGLILLIVPILLNTAFLSVIQLGGFGGTYFKEGIILEYLGYSLLTSCTLYVWTIFVGMFTGSSIAQIIFTYILNFLLVGLAAVAQYLLEGALYGFVINETLLEKFLQISPLAQTFILSSFDSNIKEFLIIDGIISIIGLVGGYFVYKYRNLETAGDVISGKYIKPIFKYGVTVCVMLVGAIYVREIFSIEKVNILVFLAFAVVGYIVAEMLIRKSFKIWDSYKGFLGFALVFIIISVGINLDLFGYETYVPESVGVKAVALNINADFTKSTFENPAYGVLYEKENIENIIELHESIVDDKDINLTENYNTDSIGIAYELIDGRIIKRRYNFEQGKYDKLLNKVFDSEEYIRATNSIFDYKPDSIYSARIFNSILNNVSYVSIDDKEEIGELLEAMKKDILNTTTDEKKQYRKVYTVELIVKEDKAIEDNDIKSTQQYVFVTPESREGVFIHETFNINDENFEAFITEKGYKDNINNYNDIISIVVRPRNDGEIKQIVDNDKIVEIMDLLSKTSSRNYKKDEEYFSLEINMKNGQDSWVDVSDENKIFITKILE